MAGASLLTLIDDITTLLDDVALLTKKAGVKTAGVLGDDLALNAEQVSGVRVDRELPVVWAVFKGSLLNKLLLVPLALAISAFAPWLVVPLLTIGGLFLCFEGAEKLLHPGKDEHAPAAQAAHAAHAAHGQDGPTPAATAAAASAASIPAGGPATAGRAHRPQLDEKTRVRGAIRTDFILSAEIIAITLGTVSDEPLLTQVMVLSSIALLITVGVYGLVAGIVKLDDLGLYLSQRSNGLAGAIGRSILLAAPWLMKGLSVAGTAAMFLVGGSIVLHGLPFLHHLVEPLLAQAAGLAPLLKTLATMLIDAVVGLLAGIVVLLAVGAIQKLRGQPAH